MGFPDSHKQNVTRLLRDDLESVSSDKDLTMDRAFIEVVLDYLGYSEERDYRDDHVSDGAGDRGIDFWDVTDKGIHVFQFKAITDLDQIEDENLRCGPGSLSDLSRIQALLASPDDALEKANARIKEFIRRYKGAMARAKENVADGQPKSAAAELSVSVTFCSLSHGFTEQAQEEFEKISSQSDPNVDGVVLNHHYRTVFIEDLLQERWREDNTAWRDQSGKKRDRVSIELVDGMLAEAKSCLFFAKAKDLVRMFEDFGYQIFEPNVRCEIKRSAVNEEIRASVGTQIGRKEFKHLNNGITMICSGFAKKLEQTPPKVIVTQPGVINGLQTVKSLADAYANLPGPDRDDFNKHCQVLVRLHQRDAVKDYRVLVKSTNNQNPMQRRNLKSNDAEQITYERLFAEFNWFYERKQGAWAAFQSNTRLWGTLRGKRKSDFKTGKLARTVDNEQLGQCWLAFIGYSNEAVQRKTDIFKDDDLYELIYRSRPFRHSSDYGFKLDAKKALQDCQNESADPKSMLAAYLLRELARKVVPPARAHKEDAIKRLGLSELTKEGQADALNEDNEYLNYVILRAVSYIFPEFVGYCMHKAFGSAFVGMGSEILNTGTMKALFEGADFGRLRQDALKNDWGDDENDFVQVMWQLFKHMYDMLLYTHMKNQWLMAPNRTRYNYRYSTREMFFKELSELDKVVQRKGLSRAWAGEMNDAGGVFNYVKSALS